MEKSPFIKKSPEIKAYQYETLFSRTFFLDSVWFYTKKPSEKKSSKWKCMIHNGKKSFFLGFSFPGFIFFRTFLLRSYFLRLYSQPPYYFRKKSPRNPKHRTLFPLTCFPRTWENSDFFQRFLFPGFFFQKLFIPGLSYLDSFIYKEGRKK